MNKRFDRSAPQKKDAHNINQFIRAKEVRLLTDDGEQLGVKSTAEALRLARDAQLDLVEISPNATPPVCKIMDYGKFKYQLQKKAHEAKKNQQKVVVKEITMRPGTEEHDFQVKLRKIREFIASNAKVKVTVRFRGREMAHQELGKVQIERMIDEVADIGSVEGRPNMQGRMMSVMLSPGADKKRMDALKAKADSEE